MTPKKNSQDNFVQEYLYIDDYYEVPKQKPKPDSEEEVVERGVIVIDLM